jgi:ABC-type transport system involved in multi-copper enzyme maturation permease subunit
MMNPILIKEMRSMLREKRGWLVPMVYAAVLAAAVALFLAPQVLTDTLAGQTRDQGQFLLGIVAMVQAAVLSIFAPLVGAALVAGEREQSTWLSLIASPASRWQVTSGKAAAGLLYLLLIMCVSAPIAALGLLMGAVDLPTLLGLYIAHGLLGVALVSLGVAVSTLFRRTWTAGLVSVGLTISLAVVTIALSTTLAAVFTTLSQEAPAPETLFPLAFNPFLGTFLFLSGPSGSMMGPHGWADHFLAMLVLAASFLAFSAWRIVGARD